LFCPGETAAGAAGAARARRPNSEASMVSGDGSEQGSAPPSKRIIKRYTNRKLYDTKDSRYVTLLQIAEMVRSGEDVQIIDNATKEDKTDVTLALIISEELRTRPRGIPLGTLRVLIRQRGEKILSHLREGPIGKLIPAEQSGPVGGQEDEVSHGKEGPQKGLRATLEQWQSTIDERIRTVLPNFSVFREIQAELKRLGERVAALEKRMEQPPRSTPPE
jgi:polyhydroxyalkanoate synthesis repressor PhaR